MQDDQTPWQASPDAASAPEGAAADQQVGFDLPCTQCRYNLRGLFLSSACPECGQPVKTTFRPDLLHFADTGWLGTMRKGLNWVITAIVLSLIMIPVSIAIVFLSVESIFEPSSAMPIWATLILSVFGLIISAIYVFGVWLITGLEPDKSTQPRGCLLARWLIPPGLLLGLLPVVLTDSNSPSIALIGSLIDNFSSTLLLIGFLAGLIYLRSMASRVPDPKLAKQTNIVFWGNLVTMSIFILVSLGATFVAYSSSNAANSSPTMVAIGLLMCPLSAALLVFGIWWIVQMFQYRARFVIAHERSVHQQAAFLDRNAPSNIQ